MTDPFWARWRHLGSINNSIFYYFMSSWLFKKGLAIWSYLVWKKLCLQKHDMLSVTQRCTTCHDVEPYCCLLRFDTAQCRRWSQLQGTNGGISHIITQSLPAFHYSLNTLPLDVIWPVITTGWVWTVNYNKKASAGTVWQLFAL
jgi:hypothetical protein